MSLNTDQRPICVLGRNRKSFVAKEFWRSVMMFRNVIGAACGSGDGFGDTETVSCVTDDPQLETEN